MGNILILIDKQLPHTLRKTLYYDASIFVTNMKEAGTLHQTNLSGHKDSDYMSNSYAIKNIQVKYKSCYVHLCTHPGLPPYFLYLFKFR